MNGNAQVDSEFIRKFKELKAKRNNHLIDEPDFDEAVEQLAADTYSHDPIDGYCCACKADIAFMESSSSRRSDIVSRLEVIDDTRSDNRSCVLHKKDLFRVDYDIQDEGRTLKIFLSRITRDVS